MYVHYICYICDILCIYIYCFLAIYYTVCLDMYYIISALDYISSLLVPVSDGCETGSASF